MQNKRLLLLIALGIVAVFNIFYGIFTPLETIGRRQKTKMSLTGFTPSRTKQNLLTKERVIPEAKRIITGKGVISLTRSAKRSDYSSWGRNPFSVSKAQIKRFGRLIINGILWDKENPMAIINEEIVKIGDKINGNTVVGIKQDRVILNDGNKDIEFLLGQ